MPYIQADFICSLNFIMMKQKRHKPISYIFYLQYKIVASEDGKVEKVLYHEGDSVEKGKPLVKMEGTPEEEGAEDSD